MIFLAFGRHPEHPLVVAANRDEFYDRPTVAAASWVDHPQVMAGRDLAAGGTWLGVTDDGKFAAVTNFREPGAPAGPLSRGALVADFLIGHLRPQTYLETVSANADKYSGFNLLIGHFGTTNELFYFSNRENKIRRLKPGIYGLSNHLLNTAWPKVSLGGQRFAELVAAPDSKNADYFDLLSDETLADDADLPDTGVGPEREKVLSPIFVRTPVYGTRSSTLVMFNNDGTWSFEERVIV